MLNKAIIVCFILVLVLVIFMSVSGKSNNQNIQTYAAPWTFSGNSNVVNSSSLSTDNSNGVSAGSNIVGNSVQVSGGPSSYSNTSNNSNNSNNNTGVVQVSAWDDVNNVSYPANLPPNAGIPPLTGQNRPSIGVVWQRDPDQYANTDELKLWSPSACSVAATASVLAAFGQKVKVSDILPLMQSKGGLSPRSGLSDYNTFGFVAQRYGLHAILDENHDLEAHYNSILSQLKANQPVIVNVQDSTYFPSGHFVVAYRLNDDGSIAVMNPDPTAGKTVLQSWSPEGFKLYFSRTMRSILFTR